MARFRSNGNRDRSCKLPSRWLSSKMTIRDPSVSSRRAVIIALVMTLPPPFSSLPGDGIGRAGKAEPRLPLSSRRLSDEEASRSLGGLLGEDPAEDPGSGSLEVYRLRQGREAEVHHEISPLESPERAHEGGNLRTLCVDCHLNLHGRKAPDPEVLAWQEFVRLENHRIGPVIS